jgi:hypothetical protein
MQKVLIMMKMRVVIWISLLAALGSGCEKEYYLAPVDQPVYFEYHYRNHAWGEADNGWLIDNEGKQRGFNFPEDYRWPDSTGHISLMDLTYNLGQTDTLLHSFSRKEIEKHTRLIGGATDGILSEFRVRGADMGSATLSCYAYDLKTGTYKHILLAATGDWEQFNQSEEAEKLVDWMKDLGGLMLFD